MARALENVVVIDLCSEMWSSLAGALLGDFGADVIRVEDLSRAPRNPDRDGRHPQERIDAEAELIHRNKRSVGLDLHDPAGRIAFEKLLCRADVFLTDLPFSLAEEEGWAYEQVAVLNPDIVYGRGSGFGPRGPDRDLPAFDELAAGRTGVMPSLGQPGQPPVYAGHGQMYSAVMLAFGVMTALRYRDKWGEGQVVDASLFAGNLYAASLTIDAYLASLDDRLSDPVSRLDSANPMSGANLAYPTSDGRWVILTMPDSDRWWPRFSAVMGLDENDPRFATHDLRCGTSRLEMMALLEELFSRRPASYWRSQFAENHLSADIVEKYDYPASDDQAVANRYILNLDHPSWGRFQSLGFPIHMSETPAHLSRMASCTGQHTGEVLAELLGCSPDEIELLESQGAAGTVRNAHPTPAPAGSPPSVPPGSAPGAQAAPARALEGLRVLDLTVWFQGPVCAQHLADLGAEVIHIERPGQGDQARGVRSINAVPVGEWNQYFLVVNRNKKSMAIDLKTPKGRELFDRLVAVSDVFLSNLGTESLRSAGLDYERLASINPGIIYATNTGYGHRGVDRPAFDMTVQALTGLMTRLGEPGQPPVYLGLGGGDAYGGLLSALGIMIALYRRDKTGRGQHVDASLYGAQLLLAAPSLQPYLATGSEFYADQHARRDARNPLWNRYRASDKWMFMCLDNTDENWQKLCKASGGDDLRGDPRFASVSERRDNSAALVDALDGVLSTRTAKDWTASFAEFDIPAGPINVLADVARDAQAWANDYFVTAHCSEVNREVELRGLPVTLSRTPGRVDSLGPELGQDTELILLDTLGCDWDEITELKTSGAIP